MDTATTITVIYPASEDALYKRYQDRDAAQPCHLDLDLEDGELMVYYNPTIGGSIPDSVHHRRRFWLAIPCLTGTAARELLDAVAPAAQRVLDGATIDWDGHNHVGHLAADAIAAYDTLEALVERWSREDYPTVQPVDVEEWIREGDDPCETHELTADTTDAELAEMVRKVEDEIRSSFDGVCVPEGVEEHLTKQRDVLRQRCRDELTEAAAQVIAATDRRNTLIRRVRAWNTDSDREIGSMAGVSHTTVARIDNG
jgi:hypothetical protein